MAFWRRLFGRTAVERTLPNADDVDEAEISAYRFRALLDQVIECREVYSSTSDRAVERRMAEKVKQLAARIDALLARVTNRREIEVVVDTFVASLIVDNDGQRRSSYIEGRVIWVEGYSCRGIQRIIADNLSRFGNVWLKVLTSRFDEVGRALIRGGGAAEADRAFECHANFFLLTNTEAARQVLESELARFTAEELNRSLDPFSKIRDALAKGRQQLSGSWDDHWEGS